MSDLPTLTKAGALEAQDLLYAVVDPGGTPLDRAITAEDLANSEPFASSFEDRITNISYERVSPAQVTVTANSSPVLHTWAYEATRRGLVEFFATVNLYGASGTQAASGGFILRDTASGEDLGYCGWRTNGERQVQATCWGKLFMPSPGSYEVALICTNITGSAQAMQTRDTDLCITRTDF